MFALVLPPFTTLKIANKMKTKKTYYELLQDPKWQKRRLEILSRDNYTCTMCGDTEKTLHVHHKMYIKNNDPWDYDNKLLQTLCKDCHFIVESESIELESIIHDFLITGFTKIDIYQILTDKFTEYINNGTIATNHGE